MELLLKGAAALGIRLDDSQIERFERYYRELIDWNARISLTTVTEREQVQTRHFLDSLAACVVLPPGALTSGARVADVGSGGGMPGLPMKIAFPRISLTLIESTAKKTAFLRHVTGSLEMDQVDVLTGRAEELARDPALREGFGIVLARAVARLPVLAELVLPLCRPGGLAVVHRGPGVDDELREARRAIGEMGGALKEVREVGAADAGHTTTLVVLEKVAPTPERYPRRPGIPAKRPL